MRKHGQSGYFIILATGAIIIFNLVIKDFQPPSLIKNRLYVNLKKITRTEFDEESLNWV